MTATAAKVENYPGFPEGIGGVDLAERVHKQAENAGVRCLMSAAKGIEADGDKWLLHTSTGDIRSLAVIVCAGAFPRSMMVPGEKELRHAGVSYCATCDGFFYKGRVLAVVGGGNTAVDEAVYLSEIAAKVYLVHRRDELRAESYLQERAFARPNIEMVWNSVPTAVLGEAEVVGLRVRDVKTDEERDLQLDGVFVAIGHIAQTDWLGDVVKLKDRFIETDREMATSAPGIFAAGDIRDTPLRQITTAVGDASIAAYSAYHYVAARRRIVKAG